MSPREFRGKRAIGTNYALVGGLNFHRSVEHKVRRAVQPHLGELPAVLRPAHFQRVPALYLHPHRGLELVDARTDERRRCHPCAAVLRIARK